MKTSKQQRGFTLIELLVVIAIIGTLASVVLASLNSARERAQMAKKESELKALITALEMYYIDTNTVPANITSAWRVIGQNYSGNVLLDELVTAGYFSELPTSPDNHPYYYYDYGSYVIVASRMTPRRHGPWQSGGYHCYPGYPNMGSDYIYCVGFQK